MFIGLVGCKKSTTNEIVLAHWANSIPHEIAYQKIADQYNASQDKVKIKIVKKSAGDYRTWLLSQLASGNVPDIVMTESTWASIDKENGYIEDLTPYLDQVNPYTGEKWLNSFEEDYMKITQDPNNSDHWNTIPTVTVSTRMYYNVEMFNEYGISLPTEDWTFEEFITINNQFIDLGITPFVMANSAQTDYLVHWINDLLNAQILDELYTSMDLNNNNNIEMNELTRAILTDEIDFSDPEYLEGIRIIKEKWLPIWNRDFNSRSISQAHDGFLRQDNPMFFNGSWTVSGTELCLDDKVEGTSFTRFDYRAVPFPRLTRQTTSHITAEMDIVPELGSPAFLYAIPSITKHRKTFDHALDFLRFLTAPENFKLFVDETYDIPIIKGVEANDKIHDFLLKGELIKVSLGGKGLNVGTLEEYGFKSAQLYLAGEMTLEEYGEELQRKYYTEAKKIASRNDWNESNNWGNIGTNDE